MQLTDDLFEEIKRAVATPTENKETEKWRGYCSALLDELSLVCGLSANFCVKQIEKEGAFGNADLLDDLRHTKRYVTNRIYQIHAHNGNGHRR